MLSACDCENVPIEQDKRHHAMLVALKPHTVCPVLLYGTPAQRGGSGLEGGLPSREDSASSVAVPSGCSCMIGTALL